MEVFSQATTTYLYIKNKRVLGCLVVSNEDKCYEMLIPQSSEVNLVTPVTENKSSQVNNINCGQSPEGITSTTNKATIDSKSRKRESFDSCSIISNSVAPQTPSPGGGLEASSEWQSAASLKVPLILGVRVIWVHQSMRRNGVASKLLDAARKHYMFGAALPRSACAFTSPTADGHLFATRYCGTENLLVFNP
jgi:hypothetical protein